MRCPDVLRPELQDDPGGAPHPLAVGRGVLDGGEAVGGGLAAVLHPRPPLPAPELHQARQIKLQTSPTQIKMNS